MNKKGVRSVDVRMANGGTMMKKKKGMAKGGKVKANAGASVPPNRKARK